MRQLILADDNLTTQKVFQLTFAEEDVEVSCFDDGAGVLAYLKGHPADIVVLNLSLPDMDGYDLCRQIRAQPTTAGVPVVMLVGAFQTFDERRAAQVGCRQHLSKPFETSTLVSMVQGLFERRESPEPAPVPPKPEKAGLQRPTGTLFQIPLRPTGGQTVFKLSEQELKPTPAVLERDAVPTVKAPPEEAQPTPVEAAGMAPTAPEARRSQVDLDRIVDRVMERLPQELRKILPDLVEDLRESSVGESEGKSRS